MNHVPLVNREVALNKSLKNQEAASKFSRFLSLYSLPSSLTLDCMNTTTNSTAEDVQTSASAPGTSSQTSR